MSKNMNGLGRRLHALVVAAVVGGAGLLANPVLAADRLVVGTWGGDYSKLVKKNIGDDVAKAGDYEVIYDEALEAPRQTKMMAEKALPRGTSDVQALINLSSGQLAKENVLEKLDFSKMPNAKNLLPVLRDSMSDYVMPQVYSGMVILYNPALFPTPPKSYADLFKPGYIEKLGFIDQQSTFIMIAASMAATGKPYDMEAAKAMLMKARTGAVKIVPTNEAMAQALKSGDVGITVMWKARAVQWQNAGVSVKAVAPSEGVMLYVQGFAIPKNARNKAGAYAMLNQALAPAAQEAFARDFGYNPTVSDAKVPDDLRSRIGFTDDERKLMFTLDAEFVRLHQPAMRDWWDKSFKG